MRTLVLIITTVMFLSGLSLADTALQITSVTTPTPVAPGNSGFVTLTITNAGVSYIDKINIRSVNAESPILLKSNLYQDSIGSLAAGKTIAAVMRFEVNPDTNSGFYNMDFSIEACGTTGICDSYIHSSVVTVQSPSNLEISSFKPTAMMAGETTTMIITIRNNGNSAINNVLLSWQDSGNNILPLGSDNRKFVSSVEGNSQINLPVEIIVNPDAVPGVYSLGFNIIYDDMTGSRNNISSAVGFTITGDFKFIVTTESQDTIVPGSRGSFNIKIANAGSQDAELMILRIEEADLEINPSVIYIGKIQSDDYDSEKLNLKAGSNIMPGIYKVGLLMEYKDIFGNSYNETMEVPVIILSPEEVSTGGDSNWFILLLILIVVGYIVYRRMKKK